MGPDSNQQLAARQDLQAQLHSSDGAVLPLCLVGIAGKDGTGSPHADYRQCGSADINLQVLFATFARLTVAMHIEAIFYEEMIAALCHGMFRC